MTFVCAKPDADNSKGSSLGSLPVMFHAIRVEEFADFSPSALNGNKRLRELIRHGYKRI